MSRFSDIIIIIIIRKKESERKKHKVSSFKTGYRKSVGKKSHTQNLWIAIWEEKKIKCPLSCAQNIWKGRYQKDLTTMA